MAAQRPLRLITTPLFNPSEGYANYVVPAILVLILQQTLLIGIGMVGGTARENRALPAGGVTCSAFTVISGKAAAYLGLYAVHAVYYFFVVFGIYGFSQRGTPITIMLFLLPFLLSIIALGLALEGLFPRRETALRSSSSPPCRRYSWPASPGQSRPSPAGSACFPFSFRAPPGSRDFFGSTRWGRRCTMSGGSGWFSGGYAYSIICWPPVHCGGECICLARMPTISL